MHSDRSFELSPSGNIQYVYIFGAVAIFILLIACINFMNLTTARSAGRAKEVGIRKVLGTERRFLIFQFLTESTLMASFQLVLAIVIAYLVLPIFNDVASKSMLLGSLFLSTYPAPAGRVALCRWFTRRKLSCFFSLRIPPDRSAERKTETGSKQHGLRSVLVVFQFVTSIVLIVGTLVIYKQLHYIQIKRPGL